MRRKGEMDNDQRQDMAEMLERGDSGLNLSKPDPNLNDVVGEHSMLYKGGSVRWTVPDSTCTYSDPNLGVLRTDPETMLMTWRCGTGYMGAKQDGIM